jgi:micrococcal nuclease
MMASIRGALDRFLAGAGIALLLSSASLASTRVETGRVVWVSDGDTVTVRLEGVKEKVRLIGIDTPELKDERHAWRDLAYDARAFARTRLLGKTVALERDRLCSNRDKYGRLLRYVVLDDGTDFNEELIREGFARAYTRFAFTREDRYRAAEKQARAAGRGRWGPAIAGPAPLPRQGGEDR